MARSRLYTPSWKQGFAGRAAESAYPGLWKGLVSAHSPGLGKTGLTLRDISGYGNHGLLTDMDPATDWILADHPVGGHALQFNGIDESVVMGTDYRRPVKEIGISFWMRVDVMPVGGYHDIMIGDANLTSLGAGWAIQCYNTNRIRFWVNHWNNNAADFIPFTDTTGWHHIVGIYDGATIKVWVDGVLGGTTDTYTSNIDYTDATGLELGQGYIAGDGWYEGRLGGVIAVYNRVITDVERKLLFDLPLALITPRARIFPVAAAAPPGNRRRRLILLGA